MTDEEINAALDALETARIQRNRAALEASREARDAMAQAFLSQIAAYVVDGPKSKAFKAARAELVATANAYLPMRLDPQTDKEN